METFMTTRSQECAADVSALLRARNPLIYIVSREEARVERYLIEAAAAANYIPLTWDVGQGVTGMDGKPSNLGGRDPGETLEAIRTNSTRGQRTVWIMRDLPAWLTGPAGATTLRQ